MVHAAVSAAVQLPKPLPELFPAAGNVRYFRRTIRIGGQAQFFRRFACLPAQLGYVIALRRPRAAGEQALHSDGHGGAQRVTQSCR